MKTFSDIRKHLISQRIEYTVCIQQQLPGHTTKRNMKNKSYLVIWLLV